MIPRRSHEIVLLDKKYELVAFSKTFKSNPLYLQRMQALFHSRPMQMY